MDNNTSLYVGIAAFAALVIFQKLRTKKAGFMDAISAGGLGDMPM